MDASDPLYDGDGRPEAPEEQIRAALKWIKEKVAVALSEFVPAIIQDPANLATRTRALMIDVFDSFAQHCLSLVSDDKQLRTFFLPALDKVAKKLVKNTDDWTGLAPDLWPENKRQTTLALLQGSLVGRQQHWKARAMKQLRESNEANATSIPSAAAKEPEAAVATEVAAEVSDIPMAPAVHAQDAAVRPKAQVRKLNVEFIGKWIEDGGYTNKELASLLKISRRAVSSIGACQRL